MARRRRIASQHAVGAALDPASMAKYIQDYFGEQGTRIDARTKLQAALSADPSERAGIAQKYAQDVQGRTSNLASRGLDAQGYSAADLTDIERSRILAETQQNVKLRAAQAEYSGVIGNLNNSRAAEDANYALLAGQNVRAGTGRYKNEKPGGWKPPSLAGTPNVDPNTGQPVPAATSPAPTPKPPTTLGPTGTVPPRPTGQRLQTTPLTSIRKSRPKLALGYARRVAVG